MRESERAGSERGTHGKNIEEKRQKVKEGKRREEGRKRERDGRIQRDMETGREGGSWL